jgi:polysaccharide biosynthesis/export protein
MVKLLRGKRRKLGSANGGKALDSLLSIVWQAIGIKTVDDYQMQNIDRRSLLAAALLLTGSCLFGAQGPLQQADYILGPGDQIVIQTIQVKEIADKPFRLEANGTVNLPLAGRVDLNGLSLVQAEAAITKAVEKYYRDPDIAVTVGQFRTEPVSVIGAVGIPGVHEARGRTTLLEMLSSAGGVRADAGPVVKITRQQSSGPIPLANARDAGGGTTVAEVDLRSLIEARNPTENILVEPYDVIAVPNAEVIYVVGNVKKSGRIPLGGRTSMSALEALSVAEGLDQKAAPSHARIMRADGATPTAERKEIPVNLAKILSGKSPDINLEPNDILFVPNSSAKGITARAIEAALQIGTGVLILHP